MILNQVISDLGEVGVEDLRARLESIGKVEETVFDQALVTSVPLSLAPLKTLKKVTQTLDELVPSDHVYSNQLRIIDQRGR